MPTIDYVAIFDTAQDTLDMLHGMEIANTVINVIMGVIAVLMAVVFYISISATAD